MKKLIQILFFFLLLKQICLAQWVQIGINNKSIKDIEVRDTDIFVITSDSGIVFHSVDNGVMWNKIVDSNAFDIDISQSGKLFMIKNGSLFSSSNISEGWQTTNMVEQIKDSLPYGSCWSQKIFISPQGIIYCNFQYAGNIVCAYDGFALSNDSGLTWTTPNLYNSGRLFAFRNQFILTFGYSICTDGGGGASYLSSDYGHTWESANIPAISVLELFSNGNIIAYGFNFDAGRAALIMSQDTCRSWIEIDTLSCQVGTIVSIGSSEYLMVGTENLGVFLFSDGGNMLGTINEGLTNLNIQALTADNNGYIYAGTENGLWRRPISEITSVKEENISIPLDYVLFQNYPNPFNPSTKIKYSIKKTSYVILKLYNILGEEIKTLINDEKLPGVYEVEFNPTFGNLNLASGIYFYQLKAGEFVKTKKMILLK